MIGDAAGAIMQTKGGEERAGHGPMCVYGPIHWRQRERDKMRSLATKLRKRTRVRIQSIRCGSEVVARPSDLALATLPSGRCVVPLLFDVG